MTSHLGRLYTVAVALVVFFLAWAVVASHPWASTAADPRLKALAVREAALRQEAKLVQQVVARRWAAYRAELKARQAQNTAARNVSLSAGSGAASTASRVRVVNLPPLTVTRTS